MADLTFDAVIIGGGNKGLLLAMYLMKYGGMSVGIFERRHEIGGCLATEETSAPGFRGNTHANIILPMYYLPVWRDFPDFWEYGGRWDQHLCSDGFVFRNNETALGIYSTKYDPDAGAYRAADRPLLQEGCREMAEAGNTGAQPRVLGSPGRHDIQSGGVQDGPGDPEQTDRGVP